MAKITFNSIPNSLKHTVASMVLKSFVNKHFAGSTRSVAITKVGEIASRFVTPVLNVLTKVANDHDKQLSRLYTDIIAVYKNNKDVIQDIVKHTHAEFTTASNEVEVIGREIGDMLKCASNYAENEVLRNIGDALKECKENAEDIKVEVSEESIFQNAITRAKNK